MAKTKVVFYKEDDGTVPVLKCLDKLPMKAQLKCLAKIERLHGGRASFASFERVYREFITECFIFSMVI